MAHLVKDLARLRIRCGINFLGLHRSKRTQDALGNRRVHPQHEHCCENPVASKNRAEPRNARVRI
ncbi:hypothetical protein D3C71_973820 [compost metagenome]